MTAHLCVTNGGQLIDIVPHLLTFRPDESVIAVFVKGRRIALTARYGLPSAEYDAAYVGAHFRELAEDHAATGVGLIFWTSRWTTDEPLADVIQLELGLRADPVLLTDGQHWWDLVGGDPDTAHVVPVALGGDDVWAQPVYASRDELAAEFSPPDDDQLAELVPALHQAVEAVSAVWGSQRLRRARQLTTLGSAITVTERVELGLLAAQDDIVEELHRDLDPARAAESVTLWRDVVSVLPADLARGALTMAAFAGWLSGNGAVQLICMDLLVELGPHPGLWDTLSDLYHSAVPPTEWDRIRLG